ncbi:MAG: hypothetical protein ACYTKD_20825 [Planctomycetota bacterium]|jgi:hypothetical protein
MRCQVCGTSEQREGMECRYCGATVRSVLGKGMPLPAEFVDERKEDRARKLERAAQRRKSRLIWHSAGGAIVLYALALWVHLPAIVLFPREALIGLLISIPIAIVFGWPIGFVTSWLECGPLGGALIGAGLFAVGMSLIGGGPLLSNLVIGALPGVFVGALMGYHVQADKD